MPFLLEFLRSPRVIGAVAASGTALTQAMIATVPLYSDPFVVELGPGTGAMTGPLQNRLAGRGRQLALEVNPRMAARFTQRYPTVEVVHADAADIVTVLGDRGVGPADVIVSGLPWAAFPEERQRDILDAVVAGLSPTGSFTTFAYVHSSNSSAARRFRRHLDARFEEVVLGRTVWANLPPAFVYHARRPRLP